MKRLFALLNTVVLIFTLWMNYYVNSNGINGNTIGQISDKYFNLFTPADYAFSIWGLIFIGLVIWVISQIKEAFFNSPIDSKIIETAPWLIFANLGNGLWTYVWLQEWLSLSVFVMLIILLSLIRIAQELNLQPLNVGQLRWTVYWPLGLYLGWISVATIANLSAYFAALPFDLWMNDELWTAIMMLIAASLNIYMIQKRNAISFGCIGIWATLGIGVRHWNEIALLQWMAVMIIAVLLITILFGGSYRRRNAPHSPQTDRT